MLIEIIRGSIRVTEKGQKVYKVAGDIVDVPKDQAEYLIEKGNAVSNEGLSSSEVNDKHEITQEEYDAAFAVLEPLGLETEVTNKLIDAGILTLESIMSSASKVIMPIVGDAKKLKELRANVKALLAEEVK